jgi:hypothetical protein
VDLIKINLTLSDSVIGKEHTFLHNVISIPNVGDIITVKYSPLKNGNFIDIDFKVIKVNHRLEGIELSDRYDHLVIPYYLDANSHTKSSINVICNRVRDRYNY